MTNTEKFGLWNFEIISSLNDHMNVVRNRTSNNLMIHLILPDEMFGVMQKLCDISNPHIMKVYDTLRNNGKCFSLCEYVDGVTLEKYVRAKGTLDEKEAKRILLQICNGLSALHAHDIIHRDINPSNVMIINGYAKIIDFDITRLHKDGQQKDTRIFGTPGYTSPEQFGFLQTDAQADIYSCGVLLSYLLTGTLPDEQKYSGPLKDVIAHCMEIDKDKRFRNIDELSHALKKRHYLYGRFLPLPGFRKNKFLPKLLVTAFYAAYALFLSVVLINYFKTDPNTPVVYGSPEKTDLITILVVFGFWSLFPYLLWGDFGRMSEVICKRNPKAGKCVLVLLGFLSIIIGLVLLAISR